MKQQIEWIPIKVIALTEEHCCIWDCPVPNDNEEVLITLINGVVDMTTFYDDYFEGYEWEDISAWAKLPKPYTVDMNSEKETFEIDTANMLYKNEMFKGIFISDKIFMVKDNGENEDIKDWLKIIIKEAVWEALNGMQIIQR